MRDLTRAPFGTIRKQTLVACVGPVSEQLYVPGSRIDTQAISQLQLVAINRSVRQIERVHLLLLWLSPPTTTAGMCE